MDHAVKASRSHPWNKLRFENDELEELYQRYTHKIQWISVFGVVTLVVLLTGIMAILSLCFNQTATVHVSSVETMMKKLLINLKMLLTEHIQWMPLSPLHDHLGLVKVSSDSRLSFAHLVLRHSLFCRCILRHLHA